MRTAAHVLLTPIVFYFGWIFLSGFALGVSGQPRDGAAAAVVGMVALAMLPLGAWYGWRNRDR